MFLSEAGKYRLPIPKKDGGYRKILPPLYLNSEPRSVSILQRIVKNPSSLFQPGNGKVCRVLIKTGILQTRYSPTQRPLSSFSTGRKNSAVIK
jgi:hypothetical protein